MIIVGSANALSGLDAGWEVLAAGGSALDAVEAAVRVVEDDPDDHTVGFDGYPNVLGEVELDASIVDGSTRRTGAVAALQGYRHPVSLARLVMERLPHVLLAGAGAGRFAEECGFAREELLTEQTRAVWRAGLEAASSGGSLPEQLSQLVRMSSDPEHVAGTVNVLACDGSGRLASAASTSGWAWKYPGRVGDSPIAGAGNWADDRYGAAACTGFGELAIRCSTARSVVEAMRSGLPPEPACERALREVVDLPDVPFEGAIMHVVALDRAGRHAGVSTRAGTQYCYRTARDERAQLARRAVLERPDPRRG